jgi:diguanylate cyclase (GGDEF)-like protein/PAS domain S-box-containing protein
MAGDNEIERLKERLHEIEASETKAREEAASLRKERQRFLDFLDRAPYGVLSITPSGKTEYANSRFTAITGYGVTDLPNIRTFLRKAFPNKRYRHEVPAHWRTSIKQGTGAGFSLVRRDGTTREVEFRPAMLGEGHLVLMVFDVTEHKRWEEAIRYMAYHDALTDLPNRTLLNDMLASALEDARTGKQKLGIVLIDLDEFKETNDRHGHQAGDLLLRTVAARVKGLIRVTDSVARVGGDEFIVLLPSIHSREDMELITGKIRRVFEAPVSFQNQPLMISASLGGAIYPDEGRDAETLISRADAAMYEEKRRKGKRYSNHGRWA